MHGSTIRSSPKSKRLRIFLGIMIPSLLAPVETQASCIENDNRFHWVGGIQTAWRDAHDVAISGTTAYVRDYNHRLEVIDISNPESPVRLGYVDVPGRGLSVTVSGTHVYLASGSQETIGYFQVVDVSNPASPVVQATMTLPAWGGDVVVSQNLAYVLGGGLQVIDVTNPASPVIVGTMATSAGNIALYGSFAYLTAGILGLQVVDLSIPTHPVLLKTVDTGSPTDLAVSGTTLYLTNNSTGQYGPPGLQILSLSNPSSPTLIGSLVTTNAGRIAVSGTKAYTASGYRLKAIDVSNPASPAIVDSVGLGDYAGGLVLSGKIVCLANGTSGLQLIEHCTNWPPALQEPGTRSGAELTFFSVTMTAADIDQDPITMSLAGPAPVWATFSDLGGGTALLSGTPQAGQAGTYPVSIQAADSLESTSVTFDIIIAPPSQNMVRLEQSGFTPSPIMIPPGGQLTWVKVAGGNHTTTNGTGPLDPAAGTLWDGQLRATSPQFLHVFTTLGTFPYFCRNHPSETGTITVGGAQTGLDEGVSPHIRLTASPNPFRSGTHLEFDLERAGPVALTILDLQGRTVRDLVAAELPAGTHHANWEGRDEHQRPVGPGFYFARLSMAGGRVEAQKLFKIR